LLKIKSLTEKQSRAFTYFLITILSITLLLSLNGLVVSYSIPDKIVEEIVIATVAQKIDLNYVVFVKSSIIYDNRTVLKPGETIYTKFFEGLNITHELKLSSSKELQNVGGTYEVYVNISSPIWFKEILVDSGDVRELLRTRSLYLNFTYLRDYISRVEREVGSSRAYTIVIVFRARTDVKLVNVSKSYTLTSTSKLEVYYDTGKPFIDVRVSSPESKYVDSYKQTRVAEVALLWVSVDIITYRVLTVITSITSAGGLAIAIIVITRSSSSKRIPALLESKYRDLIITGELEQIRHVAVVIRVKNFTDLVKVATMRRKPIVRLSSKTKFAVVDGDVTYLYEEIDKSTK